MTPDASLPRDRTDEDRAEPESRVGQRIRATHPYGYRYPAWGTVAGIMADPETGRLLYMVRFADGADDWWAVNDPDDPYEFA